ncbi:hypothetical protein B0T16DRAFT_418369 [Cercophora newfieldiana]|uniref:Integral membrane protein n=1 Tax=Cercophora newfieldiana TaxID=92897 RepID=A0AA40CJI8_9PEZI|nr:hypothetical protein B0T16DRAFT_418369 [Cercophora newfieldiana]
MKSRFGATVAGFQSKLGSYMAKVQTPSSSAYPGSPGAQGAAAAPKPQGYGQPYGQPLQQSPQSAQVQGPGIAPYGQHPQAPQNTQVQQPPGVAPYGQHVQQASQPVSGTPYGYNPQAGPNTQTQTVVGTPYGQQPQAPQVNHGAQPGAVPYGQQLHLPTQATSQAQPLGQYPQQQQGQQPQNIQSQPATPSPYGQPLAQSVYGQQAPVAATSYGQQPQTFQPHAASAAAAAYPQSHQGSQHTPITSGYPAQPQQGSASGAPYYPGSVPAVGMVPPAASGTPPAQWSQYPGVYTGQPQVGQPSQIPSPGYPLQQATPLTGSSPTPPQTYQVPPHQQPHQQFSGTVASPGTPTPASPPPPGAPGGGPPIMGTPVAGAPVVPIPVASSQGPPTWVSQGSPESQPQPLPSSQPLPTPGTHPVSGSASPPAHHVVSNVPPQQVPTAANSGLLPQQYWTGQSQQDSNSSQAPAIPPAPQPGTQSSPGPGTQVPTAIDNGGVDSCWPQPGSHPTETIASHPPGPEAQQPASPPQSPPVPAKIPDIAPPVAAQGPPTATEPAQSQSPVSQDRNVQSHQPTAMAYQEEPRQPQPPQAVPESQLHPPPPSQQHTQAYPFQPPSQPPREPQTQPLPTQTYPPHAPHQQPEAQAQRASPNVGQQQPPLVHSQREQQQQPFSHPVSSTHPPAPSSDQQHAPSPWSLSSLTSQIENLLVSNTPQATQAPVSTQTSYQPHHPPSQAAQVPSLPPISNNPYPVNGEVVITDYFLRPMLTAPFSNTPKSRGCIGNGEIIHSRKWYSHPSAPSFNVCEWCYDTYIALTSFASNFTLKQEASLHCGFHILRITRILWPKAMQSGDLSPVVAYMKHRSELKFCGVATGNPKSDGIKWYAAEDHMPGSVYAVCEACYEDVFVGGPFEGRFTPCREQQPDGESWSCDSWNDSHMRLILKGDWQRFVDHVKNKATMPPCTGEPKSGPGSSWWTVRGMGPQANFYICATCYDDVFKESRWEGVVEPSDGSFYQELACDWKSRNVLVGFAGAANRQLGAEELRRALFTIASKPKCDTKEGLMDGRYYNVRGTPIDGYGVCEGCYESRISLLGLRHFFTDTPQVVPGQTYCAFNSNLSRFAAFNNQFLIAVQTGVWSGYEDRVRALIATPDCTGIEAKQGGRWWGWPECTICETCYLDFACDTKLAAGMPMQGEAAGPEEYHICCLWSSGQRRRYLQACSKGDLPEFLEFCAERKVKWGEYWPAIQRLQAEISRTYWAGQIASTSSHFNKMSDAITFGTPTTKYVTSSGNRYNSYRGVIAEQEAAEAEVLFRQSASPREEQARLLALWGMWE